MDAISYSYADKQAKRIKKFINDPDSTSGVLTVPKVIASGESVTIPAGRVAILPDVQVDGTLNVLGDIFIPTGTANSKVVQKVASTDKAVPRFDGTNGDIQNSGVIIDNNNNITTQGSSSGTNGGAFVLVKNGATSNIGIGNYSALNGGAYDSTPTLWCQGGLNITDNTTSRVRIDSAGNVGIGVTPSAWNTNVSSKSIQLGYSTSVAALYAGTFYNNAFLGLTANSYVDISGVSRYVANSYATQYTQSAGAHYWFTAPSGTAGGTITWTNAMTLDANGSLGIGVTPYAWFASTYKTIDLGDSGSISGYYGSGTKGVLLAGNTFRTVSGNWIYKTSQGANLFESSNGQFNWLTAPAGTAGNAITWTNAMTLDNSGNLLVGANTNGMNNTTGFNVTNPSTSAYCSIGHISGTPSGVAYLNFSYNGTQIGSIYQSGTSSVVYATTSDYRLKENIRPADCKKFMDIKFVDYERIDGRHECGVIAHELQEIYPDLVTGEKDATEIRKVEISPAVEEAKDEDGNIIVEAVEAVYEEQEFPVYQQVNYMGLIARIGTVVQQQAKLIEAMRAEIDELKGAK